VLSPASILGATNFGTAVALRDDTAIVAFFSGFAVFERNMPFPDSWCARYGNCRLTKCFFPNRGLTQVFDHLQNGYFQLVSLALDEAGSTLAIGQFTEVVQRVGYIYTRNSTGLWRSQAVLQVPGALAVQASVNAYSVALSGDFAVLAGTGPFVFLFGRNEGGADKWGFVQRLQQSFYPANSPGNQIAMLAGVAVVGNIKYAAPRAQFSASHC